MTHYQSDFLSIMSARGYIEQCTNETELDESIHQGMVTGYIGYDCTAPSLHIGNLISIMMLRRFQQAGHRPIVLIGGGTTKVGDPSGKDETRQLLTQEQINKNKQTIKNTFERFLDFDSGKENAAILVDNDEWLSSLNYIEFLRDYGKHFSINKMLSYDSVKLRLEREQNLSFLEFNYMILQAYDFVELNRKYKCTLQMGGSDQWGNIVNGIVLGRRCDQASLYGLTTALLTTASGAKMGKTAQGAVWLNADMLSVWDYWQFWRNTEDADVGRFLRLFKDLPLEKIEKIEALQGTEINEAKKILATEATALLHGHEAAEKSKKAAQDLFEKGKNSADLPSLKLEESFLQKGAGLLKTMTDAGLSKSNSDARKLVQSGAVKINDICVNDIKRMITTDDITENKSIKLSVGKKRHMLLKTGD